jgi:sec-independent protein translocase protein TatA
MIELLAMGQLGMPELLVILVIIIFLFGANRIPEIAKGVGSAIRNFKNETNDSGSPRTATCSSCATVNDPDSRFCRKCGTKLS